jgi:hypothetical protein
MGSGVSVDRAEHQAVYTELKRQYVERCHGGVTHAEIYGDTGAGGDTAEVGESEFLHFETFLQQLRGGTPGAGLSFTDTGAAEEGETYADYSVQHEVGRGAFAVCLLVRRKRDGQQYVIKRLNQPMGELEDAEKLEGGTFRPCRCPVLPACPDPPGSAAPVPPYPVCAPQS